MNFRRRKEKCKKVPNSVRIGWLPSSWCCPTSSGGIALYARTTISRQKIITCQSTARTRAPYNSSPTTMLCSSRTYAIIVMLLDTFQSHSLRIVTTATLSSQQVFFKIETRTWTPYDQALQHINVWSSVKKLEMSIANAYHLYTSKPRVLFRPRVNSARIRSLPRGF